MMVNWILELIPLPITALMPIALFPLFGIISTATVSRLYMKDTVMMLFGSLAIAVAFEHCNLHRRIALRVLVSVGKSVKLLLFGFMIITMFLSMLITNTAIAAMMIPIAEAVLLELKESNAREELAIDKRNNDGIYEFLSSVDDQDSSLVENQSSLEDIPDDENQRSEENNIINPENSDTEIISPALETNKPEQSTNKPQQEFKRKRRKKTKKRKKLKKVNNTEVPNGHKCTDEFDRKKMDEFNRMKIALFLSIAYSANIGGIGNLTGTGTNIVFKGMFDRFYPEAREITFFTWLLYNIPAVIICMLLSWTYLIFVVMKNRECVAFDNEALKRILKLQYERLGKITFHEAAVFALFSILVSILFFKDPKFIKGWNALFHSNVDVSIATPTIAVVILFFVIPARLKEFSQSPALLDWNTTQQNLAWNIILIIGGGFAMAEGIKVSGLSYWIGNQLTAFRVFSTEGLIIILCFMSSFVTEIFSNVCTVSIMVPIVNDLALALKVNPLNFMIPVTVCCSCSFMLPAGTPPNAISFEVGSMTLKRMVTRGIVMNLLCCLVQFTMITTIGAAMFSLMSFPSWANKALNSSKTANAFI